MSSQGSIPLKGYSRDSRRRKVVLDVDLNDTPLSDSRVQGETSTSIRPQEVQNGQQGATLPPTIDVDAIADEVVISSPRTFAEARNNSRRNRGVTVILDEDSEVQQSHPVDEPHTRLTLNGYKRRRVPPNRTIINCELYINLESSQSTKGKRVVKPPEPPQSIPSPPPPPKEPATFSCPVCMGPLVEETSTKCGHIFCKKCIKAAVGAQGKCPTCRRKTTMKDTFRIYLPATT